MRYQEIAQQVLDGNSLTREQAESMMTSSDDDLLDLLAGAFALRRRYFGRGVMLHVLRNAKTGQCSEDCAWCSQSIHADSGVRGEPLLSVDELVAAAHQAHRRQAVRYCMVTAGKSVDDKELATLCEAARVIRAELPISICTSLGELTVEQARRLKSAGVNRYNHNLETVPRVFATVCTTHTYADRMATVRAVKSAGLELCCGGILGIGESVQERVELAFALREVDADSIPVNLLKAHTGTPLADAKPIRPNDALRALAMFRFVHPRAEIRLAGGREAILGPLQALSLYAVNSFFTEGYLAVEDSPDGGVLIRERLGAAREVDD